MPWWFLACLLTTAVGVLTAIFAPTVLIAIIGAGLLLWQMRRNGLWRTMVAISIAASVIRSSSFSTALPELAWYIVQFGPLAVAIATMLRVPTRPLRTADRAVLTLLVLFVGVAALSGMLGRAPAASLGQAGLLAFVAIFLAVTFTRRWRDQETVRGDMSTLFWTITALQLFGLFGASTASWAFDPDYGRYIGLFSNANYAGVVSAMGIAIGIYLLREKRARPAILVGIGVLSIGMLMSGSRGALLAIGAGMLVLLLSRGSRRTVLPIAGIGAAIGVVTLFLNPSIIARFEEFFVRDIATDISSGRLALYADLLAQFATSPVLGTGYRTTELEGGYTAHNIYLSVLAETGLIGASVFAALIVAIIVSSRDGRLHRPLVGAATTVAAMELTESSLFGFGGPTALTAWLIVLAFAASGQHLRDATPGGAAAGVPTTALTGALTRSSSRVPRATQRSRSARTAPAR